MLSPVFGRSYHVLLLHFFYIDNLGVQDRGGEVIIEVRGPPAAARSENIFHYFVLFAHQSAISSQL